ncbi:hypothetical protein TBR22_A28670 [Luteitalea sp. TBR-22]|uniref:hypothetical protein n=1 Tax=Luteitalea sp. TBR-22 TaxID=2802971 RepID=UPI001AF8D0E0|nr:hypothetical protein [Luteitalea sp. TBR-22]BCS33640.1 hypothetical protein TBR22_A28670 [Luteitalea sp. TBR-22]
MRLLIRPCLVVALGALSLASTAIAQPPPPKAERVAFAAGASSAAIKGQLKGDETIDYVVKAAAGQTITVTLAPTNKSTSFNVLPPGSADAAMYVSDGAASYKGRLPADGDYKVRVYLIRAIARRGAATSYALTIGVTGAPLRPLASSADALVPGTHRHAEASIPCVANPYDTDKTPKPCKAGVIRRGRDGTATVEIELGTAGVRNILFEKGKPTASDASEAMSVERKGDTTIVTFPSGERHEIPDALVTGG